MECLASAFGAALSKRKRLLLPDAAEQNSMLEKAKPENNPASGLLWQKMNRLNLTIPSLVKPRMCF
jgi:hypothetical protein